MPTPKASPTVAITTPRQQRASLPPIASSIKVAHLPAEERTESVAPSELSSDAPRKHKRRSTGSIDLTYRYHEPSDDELSWTEDELGTRRRRKSKTRRKSGAGDDFRTGIIPSEGKKRRRRRQSGQSQQEDGVYSGSGSESESESEVSEGGKKARRKRLSGKSDDFKTGIVPREGKARRRRRSSSARGNGKENEELYMSISEVSDSESDDKGPIKRKKSKKRLSGKSDDFKTGIPHVEGRRRKKRKSNVHQDHDGELGEDSFQFHEDPSVTPAPPTTPPKSFPALADGWTNIEWTILEHTHDHIRGLGGPTPEQTSPTKLAQAFIQLYENSELKKKAEEEGKAMKEFTVEEVRDRIVALRKIRDRRRSGELPPAKKLDLSTPVKADNLSSPDVGSKSSRKTGELKRRLSGLLGRFW